MAEVIIGTERIPTKGMTIESAVREAKHFPDAYIFLIDGKPIPMTSVPDEGSVVEAIRIASGG